MGSIFITNDKDGKKYELAYNRSSLVRMEKEGFNIEKIEAEPLFQITLLIRGSFYKNNPSLSADEIDAICDEIGGMDGFVKELLGMYENCLKVFSGQDKQDTKNFKWEKN